MTDVPNLENNRSGNRKTHFAKKALQKGGYTFLYLVQANWTHVGSIVRKIIKTAVLNYGRKTGKYAIS
ncbi:MAG TPA: hypothetical protein VK498_11630, partial [Ferruginibacter sp.]|nr:hypothetical protein [Ferruginibacter sp.]